MMQRLHAAILLGACIALGSCRHAPPPSPETPVQPFAAEARSPARAKLLMHDMVTIKVQEKGQVSADSNHATDHGSRWNAALKKWIPIAGAANERRLRAALGPDNGQNQPPPQIDSGTPSGADDTASTNPNSLPTIDIVADVVQVLPNGSLIIEARRTVELNGWNETMTLSGLIRSEDVDVITKAIDSNKIADLDVRYVGHGNVGDPNQSDWLSKVLIRIWRSW